ncbi:bestrophin family ion channel [Rhizobium sp. YJ-22]|uniref:bestrophin family protein n=1 Tax=Rhizobium sp. YJ-22 TaxID=3037556 RepID=UPI002412709D|nr:bestrophin family ion channel [Rhizobium sp. YJ-22]MDG3577748.1 bestrophin family ion channel [Rhizobium sp. YJ-22]
MIVRQSPTLLQLVYVLRGSVVPKILPQLAVTALVGFIVVILHRWEPAYVPSVTGLPFALIGIALSIFLGFRNNACYDRWWEARKQWGELIAVSRALGRQSLVLEQGPGDAGGRGERRALLGEIGMFTHLLAAHLRPQNPSKPCRPDFDPARLVAEGPVANRPDAALRAQAARLARLRGEGKIGDIIYQTLERSLDQLGGVQAACERIRSTPLPYAYTLLLHRTAYLFCFLFPLGFVDTLGWMTPFCSALVAYAFFGLDALGVELENPFDNTDHALPLIAMARVIEIGLLEAMGETDLPPPIEPVEHILM